jgi:antitoxin component YwqK of YwqJK toxin-antitoxin module
MNIKSVFVFLLIIFLAFSAKAQDKVYFDANWNVTTKEKAVYYRTIEKNKNNKEWIIDYYISGKKLQEANYINGKPEGKFLIYYNSGELKVIGRYIKGLKDGVWKTYYKTGKIKERGKYKDGEKVGVWKTFYKN